MTCYPIEYKMIPTQYAFLVEKTGTKYRVQVRATRNLTETTFDTEEEAREFISQTQVI
jgi:hypothetical protein